MTALTADQPGSGSGALPRAISLRPTWANIDSSALRSNLRTIASFVGDGCRVLAVVKADAYGHQAPEAAHALVDAGAWGLAVSLVEEGIELREAGVHAPVLVLGGPPPGAQDVIVHRQLRPVVWSLAHLEMLAAAVLRAGARPLPVHLKIDTGMSRLGALPNELAPLLEWFRRDKGTSLCLEGVMTHFASADDVQDDLTTARQLSRFNDCLGTIAASGLEPTMRHACNSAAIHRFRHAHFDMVRPGIALYGSGSCREVELPQLDLAMSVHSQIMNIRELPAGVRVSYGGREQLERPTRLGLVPVGYADGYPRRMSGSAQMLVRGHRCRVIGNITMDVCMLDVTDLPGVRAGEAVTLLGAQGRDRIGVHEMAQWAGVLPYEILCGISKRVPRRFL